MKKASRFRVFRSPPALLIALLLAILCWRAARSSGDAPVANLDGGTTVNSVVCATTQFADAGTGSGEDNLKVQSTRTVTPEAAQRVQGNPDFIVDVHRWPNHGQFDAADLWDRWSRPSLYNVTGVYDGHGHGGMGPGLTWQTSYGYGDPDPHIVLTLANPDIAMGPDGGELSVEVANGIPGTAYSVGLTVENKAGETGDVTFSQTPLTLSGDIPQQVDLNGTAAGTVRMVGNSLDSHPIPQGEAVGNVKNVVLTLVSVGFKKASNAANNNNYVALYNPLASAPTGKYAAVGGYLQSPQWQPSVNGQPPVNIPVCYLKNTNASVNLVIKCSAAMPNKCEVVGLDSDGGGVYFDRQNVTLGQGNNIVAIDATPALRNKISKLSKTFQWKVVSAGNTYPLGNSGPHAIYVVWDRPQGSQVPTAKRLDWAEAIADGSATITAAAEAMQQSVAGDPGYGNGMNLVSTPNPWKFLDNDKPGDCGALARLCVAGLNVLGIPAQTRYAYPTADNPATPNSCRNQVFSTAVKNGQTFSTVLEYPGNRFEGFFTVDDPAGHIKAYTVYTPTGPWDNQKYYYLQVLIAADGAGGEQLWVWNGRQTKGNVTVNDGVDTGLPHIPVPMIPAN